MSADLTGFITSVNSDLSSKNTANELAAKQAILDYAKSDYEQAHQYSAQVMTNQKQMSDIVDSELARLTQKKQSIDDAISTKERVSVLNDSYRQRYMEYTKMMRIFIIALVCFLLLFFGGKYIPIIPSIVFDILYIILFVVTCIIEVNIFIGIQRRNKLYFDRINLDPPATSDQVAASKTASGLSGNLLDSINVCIGKNCCSDGTYWDTETSMCLPGTDPNADSFSILAYSNTGQDTFSPAANSPNEFTEYTIIKR
jgi:hypothetical protein